MSAFEKYLEGIYNILNDIKNNEFENIDKASTALTNAIKFKNNIFVFGTSHAGIITQELVYRAGGLAVINPIFDKELMLNIKPITSTSKAERKNNFGSQIASSLKLNKNDIIICHSVSGRNNVMIDFVMQAQKQKAIIIAITNLKYSNSQPSRHKSGKKLFELADIVIDNHGEIGDAFVKLKGLEQKVSPSSTVAGAVIVNLIVAQTAEKLINQGIEPPILHSANIDGGEQKNSAIFSKYKKQIRYL